MIKIYIHYDVTNLPWGGLNSFLRAFKERIVYYPNIEIINNINDNYDILLMGANAFGREERIKYDDIVAVNSRGSKVIHRLDGLRSDYTKNNKFFVEDLQQIELSCLADWVIFQSNYCFDSFKAKGFE